MYEDKTEIIYAKHDDGSFSRREKHYDSNGVVVAVVDIGDVDSGTPITKEGYEQLRQFEYFWGKTPSLCYRIDTFDNVADRLYDRIRTRLNYWPDTGTDTLASNQTTTILWK